VWKPDTIKKLINRVSELEGYRAKIEYKGTIGFVFDAYLSKLSTFIGSQYDNQGKEDFHVVTLLKHYEILKQIG